MFLCRLAKIQQRVHTAVMALGYFTTKPWDFPNGNFLALKNEIPKEDMKDFDYDYSEVVPIAYFRQAVKVAKKVILNEDEDVMLESAVKHARRYLGLIILHYFNVL